MTKIPLIIKAVSFHVIIVATIITISQLQTPPAVASTATTNPQPLVDKSVQQLSPKAITGKPTAISIERLGINLRVNSGVYDRSTNEWTLSADAAYFATITKQPNDISGNTFIYGHNTDRVFAPLANLVKGDIVTVQTTGNHTFTYSYNSDSIVPPDLTSVLNDDPTSPRLTIMTCEGIWSHARRLMYFDFMEVS